MKVEVTNFYVGRGTEGLNSNFEKTGKAIEKLLNDGYKPLMQLAVNDNYSIWAFVKED